MVVVSKPSDTDKHANTGLYLVESGETKIQCWSHGEAMRIAAKLQKPHQIIMDATHEYN